MWLVTWKQKNFSNFILLIYVVFRKIRKTAKKEKQEKSHYGTIFRRNCPKFINDYFLRTNGKQISTSYS
ncbi:hypothetical protein J6590_019370 [Homalodisca vitripennis]|nr:hypothetical protein J6590_019370 [Homalodisca vitripennis]